MRAFVTVTAKQISRLQDTCYKTGRKEWLRLRDVLELPQDAPLMLRQVAGVWNVPVDELASALYGVEKSGT